MLRPLRSSTLITPAFLDVIPCLYSWTLLQHFICCIWQKSILIQVVSYLYGDVRNNIPH